MRARSLARTGVLTSMKDIAPYLADKPPVDATVPRSPDAASDGGVGTLGMVLVVGVVVAGVWIFAGRHA